MALPRFSWVTVRFLLDRKLILHFILFLYIVGVASAGESGSAGSAGEAGETRLSMARQAGGLKPAANADQTTRVRLNEAYGKLPLSFEANQGQTDPQVKFLSRGRGYGLFLTSREAVLTLAGSETKSETKNDSSALQRQARIPNPESRIPTVLRLKLVGANPQAEVTGLEELPGKSNYFIGKDPTKWRTDIPNYARVKYQEVYPGIDLIYFGNPQQLEYDFVVAPGADPKAIRLALTPGPSPAAGGRGWPRSAGPGERRQISAPLRIASNGDLMIETEGGQVRFHKPVVYQPVAALYERRPGSRDRAGKRYLDGRYALRELKLETRNQKFANPNSSVPSPQPLSPSIQYEGRNRRQHLRTFPDYGPGFQIRSLWQFHGCSGQGVWGR